MRERCDVCEHWEPTEYGYGKCQQIKDKISVDLTTGWEGAVVNFIETEADFGCNLFEGIYEFKRSE
jgi:hypothetical protein